MLISCKCLNIAGFSNAEEQSLRSSGTEMIFDVGIPSVDEFQHQNGIAEFYRIFTEFSRTTIGPLQELTETIAHTDLAYEVPLKQFSVKYCVNCKTITHTKNALTSEYWINSKLLTSSEKINRLKEKTSFSKTFGILVMGSMDTPSNKIENANFPTGGINSIGATNNVNKISANGQASIKKLTQHLDEQLQREYNEINERISRFIEQQAAILDSNREKAKQEYQILVSLVNRVPDELKVINNTNEGLATTVAASVAINQVTNDTNIDNVPSLFTLKHQQQQLTSLDTPPATPDSTPMSIGNSPTFRHQSNIFGSGGGTASGRNSINSLNGVIIGGNTLDSDCLFELEGMENYPVSVSNPNNMSDVEETEDAEDALGELEGMNIPRMTGRRPSLNIAKSLPISITAVAETRFSMESLDSELPEDRGVDIAASIKALARSVHGDTVFGDLPRPRFSTQI